MRQLLLHANLPHYYPGSHITGKNIIGWWLTVILPSTDWSVQHVHNVNKTNVLAVADAEDGAGRGRRRTRK